MPVITFCTSCKEEAGNTVSALAFGTYKGITENKKTILISTGINENTMTEGLWPEQKKKMSGVFGPNTNLISQNGMEDLERMVRANRLSPEMMSNYTRVALKGRLELLVGYKGTEENYRELQKQYAQIINLAAKAYDNVLVDLDRRLDLSTQKQIINASDIVIALTTQKAENIKSLVESIEGNTLLRSDNTIITIGKYDPKSRYNAKNLSRTFLKRSEIANTIPYNTLLFDAVQEGKLIDVFWKFLNLKIKDDNTFFIDELKRLKENVDMRINILLQTRR